MDAGDLFNDRESANIYLERYVNDGSPSGWTLKRATSEATNPFLGAERFPLLQFSVADIENITLGKEHPLFAAQHNYAHPDSYQSPVLRTSGRTPIESQVVVSPTSGGRTMRIRDGLPTHPAGDIKLTYDASRLGRVDRQLTIKHCQSSLEVAAVLRTNIDEQRLPTTFAVQLEESAKISLLRIDDKVYEWGVIYREPRPYPYLESGRVLIPGFSLFGKDARVPNDQRLLLQLIQLSGKSPRDYLLHLLLMMVDCYWSVVLNCGLHLECHAQNILFEVDAGYNITRVVARDMDSVDKDIPLAKHLGLPHEWPSFPHMCFDHSIYFYHIRPSYMYDFKLGEYLLSPIVSLVTRAYNLDPREVEAEVRGHVRRHYISRLPPTYFPPDGCWYYCDDTERKPGARREYFAHPDPKYR